MKQKFIDAFMDVAFRFSELSTSRRLKVGSIIVKDDRIISIGYNGMPSGWDNNCEDKDYTTNGSYSGEFDSWYFKYQDEDGKGYNLKTKPEVIHAEANAIAKLARGSESGDGSSMFLTHSPCIDCSKQIYASGIKNLYFRTMYTSSKGPADDGINFLKKCGVNVYQV